MGQRPHRGRSDSKRVLSIVVGAATVLLITLASPASADTGNSQGATNQSDQAAANAAGAPGNSQSNTSQSDNHVTEGTAGTSGVVTEPQPQSNADQNGTGANVTGPYDSTRDRSPSGNGSGNGQG